MGATDRVTSGYAAWTTVSLVLMALLGSGGHGTMWVSAVVVAWYTAGAGAWWLLQSQGSVAVKESTE